LAVERPPMHLLRLAVLALIMRHQPKIVDATERRGLVQTQRLLLALKRPSKHLLRFAVFALSMQH
jgi:hypothetical protein